jgi:hypothetical protein
MIKVNNAGVFSTIPNEFRGKVVEISLYAGEEKVE